jgi:hypothetical protein
MGKLAAEVCYYLYPNHRGDIGAIFDGEYTNAKNLL